jgi:hypothetical protein
MVLFVNPNPNNNRRISSLVLKGTWRLSWRNSKQKLGEKSKDDFKRSHDDLSPKRVQFKMDLVTEIPDEQEPIKEEEIREYWYKVRS